MFFFGSSKLILFLTRDSLQVYSETGELIDKLSIPDGIMNHLEIENSEDYQELLYKFLGNLSLANKQGMIILSHKVIYFKNFKISQESYNEAKEFLSKIPHNKEKISYKLIRDGQDLFISATNSELYLPILEVSKQLNFKIDSVLTINFLTEKENLETLKNINIKELLKDKKLLQSIDLLRENNLDLDILQKEEEHLEKDSEEQILEHKEPLGLENKGLFKRHFSPFYFLVIMVGIAAILGGYGYVSLTTPQKNDSPKVNQKVEARPTKSKASDSPELSQVVNKNDLKLKVLNGTGLAGEAAKLQGILEDLGFSNIELGNAEDLTFTNTEFKHNPKLPIDLVKEILDKLQNTYSEEVKVVEESLPDLDIQITTGK